MAHYNNISEHIKELTAEIEYYEKLISAAPEGRIFARKRNQTYYYSKRTITDIGTRKETYLPASCIEARLLAEKEYAKNKLADLYAEFNCLQEELSYQNRESKAVRFLTTHPRLVPLLDGVLKSGDKMSDWKNGSYRRSEKYPESIKFSTVVPGLFVRSKAEADIVSRLEHFGVPYHYDELINISGVELAMDFVCLNVSAGKKWYWDHRGMLDNPNYAGMALKRESLFLGGGLIPWVNMIVTAETKDCPLDIQWVDRIIEYFLL